jgi:hypothetical protein
VPRPVRRGEDNPVRQLMREGALRIVTKEIAAGSTKGTLVTPVPRREPDLSIFADAEIDLVKSVIDTYGWATLAVAGDGLRVWRVPNVARSFKCAPNSGSV